LHAGKGISDRNAGILTSIWRRSWPETDTLNQFSAQIATILKVPWFLARPDMPQHGNNLRRGARIAAIEMARSLLIPVAD
ncbi:MAG: hypothetical protein QF918_07060, partial [Pirellulaceae bacterium]|nr:hypothetical protein [Pirellulaceae bacterium]